MSLRNRERINRGTPDKQQCHACSREQFEHDVKLQKVNGKRYPLCSTCRMTVRTEGERGLKGYLRVRAYHDDDESFEINQDLYDDL